MRAVFTFGDRSEEILDLTQPRTDQDGIVARWLREALDRDETDSAILTRRVGRAAV